METPPDAAAASSSAVTSSGSPGGSSSSPVAASDGGGGAASPAFVGPKFSLNLPPGFRFVPTDAELILHFLRPKRAGQELPLPIFFDERVLDYHPDQLVDKYREYGENRWFFFTRRERKHACGKRPNRTTPANGHWNATGSKRPIRYGGKLVGCVATLVFYEASRKKKKEEVAADAAGDEDNGKTDWTMYEYENFTSQAEHDNGEGKIDQLVLCTIQKKKHCKQSKEEGEEAKGKKKRKKADQEGTPCADNSEKKRRCAKTKDQDTSNCGSEKKSTQVGRKNGKKGSPPAIGTKKRKTKKEIAQEEHEAYLLKRSSLVAQGQEAHLVQRSPMTQEQETYLVKRSLMTQGQEAYLVQSSLMEITPQPQHELMQAPLGEVVNTDPDMHMLHCSVTASTLSYQEMLMMPFAGTESNMFNPNYVMLHNLNQPEVFPMMLQEPTLHEHFNTMAPPEIYGPGLGQEYPSYGYGNGDHLLGTNMDYYGFSSFQTLPQPSNEVEGSTSTQGTVMPSAGDNSFDMEPLDMKPKQ